MMFFDEMVSTKQLEKIFKNSLNRSLFISNYNFFKNDNNHPFYLGFIHNNIYNSRKYKLQECAIELTIRLEHFEIGYLQVIRDIIHSGRRDWIKLLALDWLYCFYEEIESADFKEMNGHSLKNSFETIIQIQSILNLMLCGNSLAYHDQLIDILHKTQDIAVFTRVLYASEKIGLIDNRMIKELIKRNN